MMEPLSDPKSILLAIDESESSLRAVEYVGRVAGAYPDFRVTIMHVIAEPLEDYFEDEIKREEYLADRKTQAARLLKRAKDRLIDFGFAPDRVCVKSPTKTCESMAACIIDEQKKGNFGTLVVGRRGISKSEEFLFGSVSNKIIHYARHCTVWVVE